MGVTLVWNSEQAELSISDELVRQWEGLLRIAAEQENVTEGEVGLTLVDDEEIRQLNSTYRGIDRPTDVLSFAMLEETEEELPVRGGEERDGQPLLLGDIVISVPRAMEQSEAYGHSLEREIGFLIVHGFLHLIGYDHQDEPSEQRMIARQEQVLQKAGLTR